MDERSNSYESEVVLSTINQYGQSLFIHGSKIPFFVIFTLLTSTAIDRDHIGYLLGKFWVWYHCLSTRSAECFNDLRPFMYFTLYLYRICIKSCEICTAEGPLDPKFQSWREWLFLDRGRLAVIDRFISFFVIQSLHGLCNSPRAPLRLLFAFTLSCCSCSYAINTIVCAIVLRWSLWFALPPPCLQWAVIPAR